MKNLLLPLCGGLALALISGAILTGRDARVPVFVSRHENVLGTSLELKITTLSGAAADAAESAALHEIDRLAKILSTYDSSSEVSRWLRTTHRAVPVSAELFQVLGLFDVWAQKTNGALNPGAEAVNRVWRNAAAEQRLPHQQELQAAVQAASATQWQLDAAAQTATHLDTAPIALNSFTKSYIIAKAADAAMASGVDAVVVNIGGDIVVRGPAPENIHIVDPRRDGENAPPLATLRAGEAAVATSGSYRRGVDIAGVHYSHIVDPRTGQPASAVVSATVVAPDAVTAGALATVFNVLQPAESEQLASNFPGAEYLLAKRDGTLIASRGWSRIATFAPPLQTAADEVVVNFELARIEGRYRRPYVAVWVEDKDKFPIRTMALWFEKPRWLPDLKAWSRADRLRNLAEGTDITSSVSSATRPPGKYTVRWDGKDAKGAPVKPGKYAICIEAAREHGTYQILRQEIDIPGAAKKFELAGNTEVASASVEYKKGR